MKLRLVTVIAFLQAPIVFASSSFSLYLYQHHAEPIKEYMGTENDFTRSKAPKVVEFYSPHCVSIRWVV